METQFPSRRSWEVSREVGRGREDDAYEVLWAQLVPTQEFRQKLDGRITDRLWGVDFTGGSASEGNQPAR